MCRIFKMRCFSVPFIFGLSQVSRIVLAVASSSILCIAVMAELLFNSPRQNFGDPGSVISVLAFLTALKCALKSCYFLVNVGMEHC